MTFTIEQEQVYLAVIAILMVVQIFQWRYIYKLKFEINQVWVQIGILVTSISLQIEDVKKQIKNGK